MSNQLTNDNILAALGGVKDPRMSGVTSSRWGW